MVGDLRDETPATSAGKKYEYPQNHRVNPWTDSQTAVNIVMLLLDAMYINQTWNYPQFKSIQKLLITSRKKSNSGTSGFTCVGSLIFDLFYVIPPCSEADRCLQLVIRQHKMDFLNPKQLDCLNFVLGGCNLGIYGGVSKFLSKYQEIFFFYLRFGTRGELTASWPRFSPTKS